MNMENTKKCSHCQLEKDRNDFHKLKKSPDGLRGDCKKCRKNNIEEKEKNRLRRIRYYKNNREKILNKKKTPEQREKARLYAENRRKDTEFRLEINKLKRERNKSEKGAQARRKYYNEILKHSTDYKIQNCLRARMHSEIKRLKKKINSDVGKCAKTLVLLGCSVSDLKIHLESKFLPGMTWENHGYGDDCWHIDHIKPCDSFDLTDPEQQKECFHYTNLQPLWQPDNLKKSNKLL